MLVVLGADEYRIRYFRGGKEIIPMGKARLIRQFMSCLKLISPVRIRLGNGYKMKLIGC
ncbi:hypothetical protein J42TS3_20800 [Paenibacillus vini]|uniref:Uncharacterized protein n=1 Tax=Paenibacillus vini TaxID=1476024 RepID=A0ABQ4MAM7_9BACL|nr:hypothetical protein J42TS3_20800 [Paenibacillus vini]